MESLQKVAEGIVEYAILSLVGFFLWLYRKVTTNEKRIEMDRAEHKAQMESLEGAHKSQVDLILTEMKSRDELRQRDREDLQELKRDVKNLISRG